MILKRTRMVLGALLVMSLLLSACDALDFGGENGEDDGPPALETTDADAGDETAATDGEAIFLRQCAACHGEDGEGNEMDELHVPPHAGNQTVTAEDPAMVVSVVLTGRGGMPRFNEVLSDEEIARVVSYIRTAWENDAQPVEPETVTEIRMEVLPVDGEVEGTESDVGDETQGAGDQDDENSTAVEAFHDEN